MTGCPKCGFSHMVRNGHSRGTQRYRCKSCGFQFIRTTPRGRPTSEKATTVLLYALGFPLNSIARMLEVSAPVVLRRVRLFAEKICRKRFYNVSVIAEGVINFQLCVSNCKRDIFDIRFITITNG